MLVGNPKSLWRKRLQEAISPLGKLQSVREKDARAYSAHYDVVIVDETEVKRVEEVVTRFSSQLNPPHIIVVYAAAKPRWQDTLKVFKAGATDYIEKYNQKDKLAMFFSELLATPVANIT
jgi:DNA-binding response OmpR family regulator